MPSKPVTVQLSKAEAKALLNLARVVRPRSVLHTNSVAAGKRSLAKLEAAIKG